MAKYLNLPTFLISAFLIRLLVLGASIGEALVMVVLGGLYAGHIYLEHIKEPEANSELKSQVSSIEDNLVKIKSKVDAMSLTGLRK